MKEKLKKILSKEKEYNCADIAYEIFGLSRSKHYDVLVVAPGWKPTKIMNVSGVEITVTAVHSYVSGYELKTKDKLIGWIQTSAGACNLIDHLIICAELDFDKVVFVGAAGGLSSEASVGDIYTPSFCIDGGMASAYLLDDIRGFTPFEKVFPSDPDFVGRVSKIAAGNGTLIKSGAVYCTDSISCEYCHLDFIKDFSTVLIEMETAAFYRLAEMIEKPAIALLAVSDNSANGEPLIGKSNGQEEKYNEARKIHIPRLILKIAEM